MERSLLVDVWWSDSSSILVSEAMAVSSVPLSLSFSSEMQYQPREERFLKKAIFNLN